MSWLFLRISPTSRTLSSATLHHTCSSFNSTTMDTDPSPPSPEKPIKRQVYFDMSISDISIGRIVFELWYDKAPKTCENFRCLCTGEKGESSTSGAKLHYKGTLMHRVIKGFMVQGGDFTNFNGTGGESIYGGKFEDEDLTGIHDRRGLLSMANAGKDTNKSQFFITCAPSPHLDGNHVVFGRMMTGNSVLRFMEREPVIDEKTHRPGLPIKVENCGELELSEYIAMSELEGEATEKKRKRRSDSYSSSDSDSSSDRSSRRRKSRHDRHSKSSKRSKYQEKDEKFDSRDRSPSRREKESNHSEPEPQEPPKPRVDAKGREVRGRGTVSERRRPVNDRRDGYNNDDRYRDNRSRYQRGRPEDAKWRKIEDRDSKDESRSHDDPNYRSSHQRRDERAYDDTRRRQESPRRGYNDDYRGGGRRSDRGFSSRDEDYKSRERGESGSRSPRESDSREKMNDQTETTSLPPRTLVSYSNAVSLPPSTKEQEKRPISPKKEREAPVERASSPEQNRRRSPSPHRYGDSE